MAVYQTLTIKETNVDLQTNTSKVQILWKSQQTGESRNYYTRTAKYWITMNGVTTAYTVDYTLPAKTTKTILDKTITVPHLPDGMGTVNVQTWMDTRISAGEVAMSKTLTLTQIPMAGTIGATDAFVESTTVIAVSRKSEAYCHSIEFSFGSLRGFIDADGKIQNSEVKHTASHIPFGIPASFYSQMPAEKSLQCQLICRTYQGETQIGSQQTGEFTVSVREETSRPNVWGTVRDVNPKTLELTGNDQVLVQHVSKARCQISAQANNGATIASLKINGQQTEKMLEFDRVQSANFTFYAEDSRGFSVLLPAAVEMIPYIPVTVNAKVTRTDPTSGKGILEVSGQCYAQSFGAKHNRFTLEYRVNDGPASTVEVSLNESNRGYTARKEIEGLHYATTSTVVVSMSDLLSQHAQAVAVKPGIPVFDWGEGDFVFHVPVDMNGKLSMKGFPITNVRFPKTNFDGVNKAYVDNKTWISKRWENPDPSGSFMAGQVNLDLRNDSAVFLCFKGTGSGEEQYLSEIIPVGERAYFHCHGLDGSTRQRNVTVTESGLTFSDGYQGATANNACAIPVSIYAIAGSGTLHSVCGMFLCGEVVCGQ